MMLKVESFNPSHIDKLNAVEGDKEVIEFADFYRAEGIIEAIAIIDENDDVVVVCGGAELWRGVCEVWLLKSDLFYKYSRQCAKIIKKHLDEGFNRCDYHRVQASCSKDSKEQSRWLEWLGFENEGVLRKYGLNGEDYIMHARIK